MRSSSYHENPEVTSAIARFPPMDFDAPLKQKLVGPPLKPRPSKISWVMILILDSSSHLAATQEFFAPRLMTDDGYLPSSDETVRLLLWWSRFMFGDLRMCMSIRTKLHDPLNSTAKQRTKILNRGPVRPARAAIHLLLNVMRLFSSLHLRCSDRLTSFCLTISIDSCTAPAVSRSN